MSESGGRQWVVYTLSSPECKPQEFLGVADSREEAKALADKWWKAFQRGEKRPPESWEGVSERPVHDFEGWPDGE